MMMENFVNQTDELQEELPSAADDITLMTLLLVIAKHNRFILILTAVVAVIAIIYALSLPKIYTSKAVVMLASQQTSSTASLLLGQLGGLVGGGSGAKGSADQYVQMLESQTVADALIKRFKFMELHSLKSVEAARGLLKSSTIITRNKNGFITIEYSDSDPKLAAAVANAYAEELDSLVHSLAAKEASVRKSFYEKQLNEARANLARVELEMEVFQEKNRVFRLGGNAGSVTNIGAAAGGGSSGGSGGMVLGASGEIPKAELEFIRIAREVKFYEMLLAAMAQQVTSATIDMAKTSDVIQVLDKAVPAEQRSKPRRGSIVITAMLAALFFGIIFALIMEAFNRVRNNPDLVVQLSLLSQYFRNGNSSEKISSR